MARQPPSRLTWIGLVTLLAWQMVTLTYTSAHVMIFITREHCVGVIDRRTFTVTANEYKGASVGAD
jgi:hypothetical protein